MTHQKKSRQEPERAVFFGQIETYSAVKDYQRGGLCLRVFAVAEKHFTANALGSGEGVSVFALDVSYWRYCRHVLGEETWLTEGNRRVIDDLDGSVEDRGKWYRFEVLWDGSRRDGYGYPAFSEEEPRFFELVSAAPVEPANSIPLRTPPRLMTFAMTGLATLPRRAASLVRFKNTGGQWRLLAFHVGQGMCSLVTDGSNGILLDLGAGTPVVRPRYMHSVGFQNDLSAALKPLTTVDLVVSHADADHWKILAWDTAIRSKIRKIYLPDGAKAIAFQDPAVIKKTRRSDDLFFALPPNAGLHVLRSDPQHLDDNGDCLLAVFETASKRALVAGDYVYSRYAKDGHSDIKALHQMQFDAVVVPHHGDAASAKNVVSARPGAFAFFSAGTHKKYQHPRDVSRKAHKLANFIEICDNKCPDIKSRQLI